MGFITFGGNTPPIAKFGAAGLARFVVLVGATEVHEPQNVCMRVVCGVMISPKTHTWIYIYILYDII